VDSLIMRTLDIFMSIPDILFTMAVVFALGAGFINLLLALTLAYFTNYVRLVRSAVLNLADLDYVEAARAGGSGSTRIIVSHILPNAMGVIIVNTTLNVAKIILYESTLSFLGLGMPPPAPEWGLLLADAREYMRAAPYLMFFPAMAIVLCATSVNLIGDGLRDALDPHLKS
jgi:peptide/nickel transport system permease protein